MAISHEPFAMNIATVYKSFLKKSKNQKIKTLKFFEVF